MDPPRHTHVRGLISRGFTPRRVAALEPQIRQIARGHIEAALEQDGLDLVRDIASKVPMDVISELSGVPAADRERMRELGNLSAHRPPGSTDIQPESIEAISLSSATGFMSLPAMAKTR